MKQSMILGVAAVLIFSGIVLLGYLLWQKFPLNANSLSLSDLVNIAALSVALVSLYVSFETQKQAIIDSEQQQKSLESSRQQLQDVAGTLKQQQEILAKNLETSKNLFDLQKEQQGVLTNSLQATKSLYQIQKEERDRVQELASRKPLIQAIFSKGVVTESRLEVEVTADQQKKAVIPLYIRNIGTAPLIRPILRAIASNSSVHIQIEGAHQGKEHNRSQLNWQGADFHPFKQSNNKYESSINILEISSESEFDIHYDIVGDNLEVPFVLTIHVRVKISQPVPTNNTPS